MIKAQLRLKTVTLVAASLLVAAGCRSPPPTASPPPPPPPPAMADHGGAEPPHEDYAIVRVFYVTDRLATPHTAGIASYGSDRGGVEQGECQVSIPRDHRMGALEAPSIWRLEFRQDPSKHVVLLAVDPEDAQQYFHHLKDRISASATTSALVFVHGYNVKFEDAARRTAQMAYDLAFDGPSIFFSWPSRGEVAAYSRDETNVEWAKPDLMKMLDGVLHNTNVQNLYLIAHSMGNRALVSAFQELVTRDSDARARIKEVILAAPDIDADVFKNQIVPALLGSGASTTHVTLYASSKDLALEASKKFHGYARAGDSGQSIVLASGLESIDASAVDTSLVGHSYYADNRSVLSDIYYLVRDHRRACNRFALKQQQSPIGMYCVLQP